MRLTAKLINTIRQGSSITCVIIKNRAKMFKDELKNFIVSAIQQDGLL